MPYVPESEAFNTAFVDLDELAQEAGPMPWRKAVIGTSGMRLTYHGFPPGFATVPHKHPHAEEFFKVLRGTVLFTIGDEERAVGPGEVVLALRGVRHQIRVADDATEPGILLATVAPNEDRPDETIEPA
jgi:quercetin dioxygenase-like cupin family protein